MAHSQQPASSGTIPPGSAGVMVASTNMITAPTAGGSSSFNRATPGTLDPKWLAMSGSGTPHHTATCSSSTKNHPHASLPECHHATLGRQIGSGMSLNNSRNTGGQTTPSRNISSVEEAPGISTSPLVRTSREVSVSMQVGLNCSFMGHEGAVQMPWRDSGEPDVEPVAGWRPLSSGLQPAGTREVDDIMVADTTTTSSNEGDRGASSPEVIRSSSSPREEARGVAAAKSNLTVDALRLHRQSLEDHGESSPEAQHGPQLAREPTELLIGFADDSVRSCRDRCETYLRCFVATVEDVE